MPPSRRGLTRYARPGIASRASSPSLPTACDCRFEVARLMVSAIQLRRLPMIPPRLRARRVRLRKRSKLSGEARHTKSSPCRIDVTKSAGTLAERQGGEPKDIAEVLLLPRLCNEGMVELLLSSSFVLLPLSTRSAPNVLRSFLLRCFCL